MNNVIINNKTPLDTALRDALKEENLHPYYLEILKKTQQEMGMDAWASYLGGYDGGNFTTRIGNVFNKTVVEGWI